MNNELKSIIEKFKTQKQVTEAGTVFSSRMNYFLELAYSIPTENEKLTQGGRRNLIINIISALEVYLKDMIAFKKDWIESGYEELLKEKLTLSEAYKIFNKELVTREYLVAHFHSFQNISNIERIFSALTGKKFLDEIDLQILSFGDEKTAFGVKYPDWKAHLSEIFDLRHRIIHECSTEDLTLTEVLNNYFIVSFFQLVVDRYCTQNKFITT